MKTVLQIKDSTRKHLPKVSQQDTTHSLIVKPDSIKKDSTQISITPVDSNTQAKNTKNSLTYFHKNQILHKDTVNVDSLGNIFYKGYLQKDTIYHFSDFKLKTRTVTAKPIVKRTNTYLGTTRARFYPSWFIFIFIVATLAIGITRFLQGSKIKILFQSILKEKVVAQYVDERNATVSIADILLWLNYLLCLSTIFYTSFFYFNLKTAVPFSKINLLITLFIGMSFFHGLKFLLMLFTGWLFKISTCVKEYILQWSFLHQMTGILLLPFSVLIIYLKSGNNLFLYINLAIIILAYIFSLIRGILISRKHNIQLFYIFLYICTLEILPLIVLFKLLIAY